MKTKLVAVLMVAAAPLFGRLDEAAWKQVEEAGVQEGDLVFTRTGGPLFSRVGDATGSWCSHVGIVVGKKEGRWVVAESKIPVVCETDLRRFLNRSEGGRFEIRRPERALSPEEVERLKAFVAAKKGTWYDLGFNAQSKRQFCSRFAREALHEATGEWVGKEETFRELIARNPKTPLWFWKTWYFGRIPWERKTITPSNLLVCEELKTVVKGGLDGN